MFRIGTQALPAGQHLAVARRPRPARPAPRRPTSAPTTRTVTASRRDPAASGRGSRPSPPGRRAGRRVSVLGMPSVPGAASLAVRDLLTGGRRSGRVVAVFPSCRCVELAGQAGRGGGRRRPPAAVRRRPRRRPAPRPLPRRGQRGRCRGFRRAAAARRRARRPGDPLVGSGPSRAAPSRLAGVPAADPAPLPGPPSAAAPAAGQGVYRGANAGTLLGITELIVRKNRGTRKHAPCLETLT